MALAASVYDRSFEQAARVVYHQVINDNAVAETIANGATHTALGTATAMVKSSFTPERKEHEKRILEMARNQVMIEDGRYTAEQLNLSENAYRQVIEDCGWIERDNAAIRSVYNYQPVIPYYTAELLEWLNARI